MNSARVNSHDTFNEYHRLIGHWAENKYIKIKHEIIRLDGMKERKHNHQIA
jgi:hypothetical protein